MAEAARGVKPERQVIPGSPGPFDSPSAIEPRLRLRVAGCLHAGSESVLAAAIPLVVLMVLGTAARQDCPKNRMRVFCYAGVLPPR